MGDLILVDSFLRPEERALNALTAALRFSPVEGLTAHPAFGHGLSFVHEGRVFTVDIGLSLFGEDEEGNDDA